MLPSSISGTFSCSWDRTVSEILQKCSQCYKFSCVDQNYCLCMPHNESLRNTNAFARLCFMAEQNFFLKYTVFKGNILCKQFDYTLSLLLGRNVLETFAVPARRAWKAIDHCAFLVFSLEPQRIKKLCALGKEVPFVRNEVSPFYWDFSPSREWKKCGVLFLMTEIIQWIKYICW